MTAPPPMPCSAREATKVVIVVDIPHNTDPAKKNRIDTSNTALRPNRSPSLPTIAVVIVEASR